MLRALPSSPSASSALSAYCDSDDVQAYLRVVGDATGFGLSSLTACAEGAYGALAEPSESDVGDGAGGARAPRRAASDSDVQCTRTAVAAILKLEGRDARLYFSTRRSFDFELPLPPRRVRRRPPSTTSTCRCRPGAEAAAWHDDGVGARLAARAVVVCCSLCVCMVERGACTSQ